MFYAGSPTLDNMAPQQQTIQEQIVHLTDDMVKIREEIRVLKEELAEKKDKVKALKKKLVNDPTQTLVRPKIVFFFLIPQKSHIRSLPSLLEN